MVRGANFQGGAITRARGRIFVSYSHRDKEWLEKVRVALTPLLRGKSDLFLWDDSRIDPGEEWRQEIKQELERASIAILLVSQEFLASTFIAENELPPLLRAARAGGVRILWVPVGECLYRESPLKDFQAAWDPSRPLKKLRGPGRDHALVTVAEAVKEALGQPIESRVDPERHGADLLKSISGDAAGEVPVAQDWYAIPWSEVIAKTSHIECAVSFMDTWISGSANALEDFLARDGTMRFFLPKPGSAAAERVAERFPDYDLDLVERKIVNTRTKLRGMRRGKKGRVEVRWTEVFNMHCLMLLDQSILLVSSYDHFRNHRVQGPTFVVPLWRFPMVETWMRKEFKGFQANSVARLPKRPPSANASS